MEWTRPLSFALVVLVVALVAGAVVELARTTLGTGEAATASAVTLALVGLLVLAAVAVGARSSRWLRNPDHYW